MRLTIDFETRSELDLMEVGAWRYAEHHSAEVACIAFAIDEEEPVGFSLDETSVFSEFKKLTKQAEMIVAHNAGFERAVWTMQLVKQHGIPLPPFEKWDCTSARAAAVNLPRALAQLSAVLNLKQKKDLEGEKRMHALCQPHRGVLRPIGFDDMVDLIDYCKQDVRAEQEIDRLLPALKPQEREVWLMDQRVNARGAFFDREHCESAIAIMSQLEEAAMKRFVELTGIRSPRCRGQIRDWLRARGVPIVSSKGAVTAVIADGKWPLDQPIHAETASAWPKAPPAADVREACELVRALGRASVAKYKSAMERVNADGRARNLFTYCGTSTGRWTAGGFQPHNLPRGKIKDMELAARIIRTRDPEIVEALYGDAAETLSHAARGIVIAPPGKDIEVADFSAIEARGVAWIGGDAPMLAEFESGADPYITMARLVYGLRADQPVTFEQRWFGKSSILGLGFGMGANKFEKQCAQMGLKVPRALIDKAVKVYRERFAKTICATWRKVERAAMSAIRGQPAQACKTTWRMVKIAGKNVLRCELPSGRGLHYWEPYIKDRLVPWGEMRPGIHFMGISMTTKQWFPLDTYGGKLVENVVQGLARDLIAHAAVQSEKTEDGSNRKIVMHVHDELICEVDEGKGGKLIPIMAQPPAWAKGFPLNASGWIGKRYRK